MRNTSFILTRYISASSNRAAIMREVPAAYNAYVGREVVVTIANPDREV